jgi:predicted nucleotidyltransferase
MTALTDGVRVRSDAKAPVGRRRYNSSEMSIEIETNRDAILRIAQQHGARNVRVFGSFARGDERPTSDIDFLVEMDADRSLLDLVGLSQDLEALLQRRVDVLTDGGIPPAFRPGIMVEARAL